MSITVETSIFCDNCSEWFQVSDGMSKKPQIKHIRKTAKADGWIYKNKKDYCKKCKEKLAK